MLAIAVTNGRIPVDNMPEDAVPGNTQKFGGATKQFGGFKFR